MLFVRTCCILLLNLVLGPQQALRVICEVVHLQGSRDSTPQADPEMVQRSLAAVNLKRFPEAMLHDALFPDRGANNPASMESLLRKLNTASGQEAVREAALQAILQQGNAMTSRMRTVGHFDQHEISWLESVCLAIPWISWLIDCDDEREHESLMAYEDEEGKQAQHYNTSYPLLHDKFYWTTCKKELRNFKSRNVNPK